MDNDKQETKPLLPIDKQTRDLANQILDETDADKLRDLTMLFNLNIAKKNVLRVLKLDDLRDMITDNMIDRVTKVPGEFSNEELLKCMTTIEASIEKAQKTMALTEDAPTIQINQQNVNISVGQDETVELSRDERTRVLDAIAQLMSATSSGQIMMDNAEIE